MNYEENFIRFDWAAKRILRDKANFGVLEGLITVLLNEQVHIVEEKYAIASNLKRLHVPIETIAEASGLSIEEISKI